MPDLKNCPKLADALDEFEACLETPIVPGELESWTSAARAACGSVGVVLRDQINDAHPEQYAAITQEDPELDHRIEQLRDEDQQLLAQFEALNRRMQELPAKASFVEPREGKLEDQTSDVVEDGLALIIRVRRQEQAISTWYMEAFNRDRGIAD